MTGENKKSGEKMVKLPGRDQVAFWKEKLFKRPGVADWRVRIQRGRRREEFSLHTANKEAAASKARDLWRRIAGGGWEEVLAKEKPKYKTDQIATLGEFLSEAEKVSTVSSRTFADYARALRQVAAEIAGVRGDRSRYDYRTGGALAWRREVETLPLSILTPEAINRWRREYVNRRGNDPKACKSAEISASSFLRQAKALFRPEILDLVKCKVPDPPPFAGVRIAAPRADRYRSEVTGEKLFTSAQEELFEPAPEVFKALVLCLAGGLRRGEADTLTWGQVNLEKGTLEIKTTEHFRPKTPESERQIDLDATTVGLLRKLKKRSGPRKFVLAGNPARLKATDRGYRAEKTWKRLKTWLRAKGMTGDKVIHKLRKESGSIVNSRFGLEEARAFLGHSGVQVTSAHYVGKRRLVAISFDSSPDPSEKEEAVSKKKDKK